MAKKQEEIKPTKVLNAAPPDRVGAKGLNAVLEKQGFKVTMADAPETTIEWFLSGVMAVDHICGNGRGLPRGKIIEVFGKPSGFKSALTLLIAGCVQRHGGVVVLIDAEGSYDPIWGARLGVNNKQLRILKPLNGEQAFDMAKAIVRSNAVDMLIIDSTDALVPKVIIDESTEKDTMGQLARLMGKGVRPLNVLVSQYKTNVFFINQVRKTMSMYGPKETTPGGEALPYYASIRLKVSADKETIKYDAKGDAIGVEVTVKNYKNKVSSPYKESSFYISYDHGINNQETIVDKAIRAGIIERPNNQTYSINNGKEEFKFVGRKRLLDGLVKNTELANLIMDKLEVAAEYRDAFTKDYGAAMIAPEIENLTDNAEPVADELGTE